MVDKLKTLIETAEWVYAESYEDFAPHEYIERKDAPELCSIMGEKIETEGKARDFKFPSGSKEFIYVFEGNFRYWFTNNGTILNRCPKSQPFDWSDGKKVDNKYSKEIKRRRKEGDVY